MQMLPCGTNVRINIFEVEAIADATYQRLISCWCHTKWCYTKLVLHRCQTPAIAVPTHALRQQSSVTAVPVLVQAVHLGARAQPIGRSPFFCLCRVV